ncbi:MAG TPA: 50S ribosomal protein L6 [Dehalococcoidia bacterium]|nr:50S ribosomal protein L6 [Dehalococcoidia bacterium]
MSRVGKMPITLPKGVEVRLDGTRVIVKGPKGELTQDLSPDIGVSQENGVVTLTRPTEQPRHRALHGLMRALIANMVTGVSQGFSKTLEMQGVGYRAQMQGKDLVLAIGFSHPVTVPPPKNIEFEVDGTSKIIVKGINKEQVGQVAADVRKIRPPEPYKGKGIRYQGEYVRRKAGKAGKATH